MTAVLVLGAPMAALANEGEADKKDAAKKPAAAEKAPALDAEQTAVAPKKAKSEGSLGLVQIGPPAKTTPAEELLPASGPAGMVMVAELRGCAPRACPDWQLAPDRAHWRGQAAGKVQRMSNRRVRRTH